MLDTICTPETNDLPAFVPGDMPEPASQQCFHQLTSGQPCNAPALRGEYFCRHHIKSAPLIASSNSRFEMPRITDRESIRAAVVQIACRVAANSLDIRRAGTILYALRTALATFPALPRPRPEAPKAEAPSPTNAAGVEAWARAYLANLSDDNEF